jgi:hypothetical protein
MQKAGGHPAEAGLPHIVGNWFQVLFHSPSRGSFHRSLTVLFTIGCQLVFSLIRWSGQIHTEFHVHRATWDPSRRLQVFAYPAVTVFGRFFQIVQLTIRLPQQGPATPGKQVSLVWAVPLSLATTDGITSFSFPAVTEMFHFTAYGLTGL